MPPVVVTSSGKIAFVAGSITVVFAPSWSFAPAIHATPCAPSVSIIESK
jgi:hypothetical protein